MSDLWTDISAMEATGGESTGAWQASSVSIDSRSIARGGLFVALKGERFDGHDYVKDALARGAAAAVVSERLDLDIAQLIVPDTLNALEKLGRFARNRSAAKIVGVTGSVGKTSAKEMLRVALAAHGKTYATAGNLNNHIGTPLNLANLPLDTQYAVFEMGMNHAGEIAHLTRMVRPHIAAITTVEAAHMEFFDSVESIAEAKAEIFESMEEESVAILNRDNPHFDRLADAALLRYGVKRIISFGAAPEADCRLTDYRATAEGCAVKASLHGEELRYELSVTGRHMAATSLLVLAVAYALDLDEGKTAKALLAFREPEGRGGVAQLGGITLIDDSYNASPAAMRAAFAKTAELWEAMGKKGRKIAALGDMLELGKESSVLHSQLAAELQRAGFDSVFTAGTLMRHLHDVLPPAMRGGHAGQAKELLPLLTAALKPGDMLLVKGSHGSKIYELASALRDALPQEGKKKHAL